MNFNNKWIDKKVEREKNIKRTWRGYKAFKIKETKGNYIKVERGISVFVILICQ